MAIDKILVTGANGQLGTVLVSHLGAVYGHANVIATDIRHPLEPHPTAFEILDALDASAVNDVIKRHRIKIVYHLAAVLSAKGEENPLATWHLNTQSFLNILEVARIEKVQKVFFPSSIAVFGKNIERYNVGQEVSLQPSTVYGISKTAGENWSNYYYIKYGLDVRSLRYPGVIGYQSLPGGGTTDYAVEIFHKAIQGKKFTCFLKADTVLPMIYMDDVLSATIKLMEAPAAKITVRTSYNLAGMSFSPGEIAQEIRKIIPTFAIEYKPDFRQQIAESWPERIDDSAARRDWNWKPRFDLSAMTRDMLYHLELKYDSTPIAG